VGRRRHRTGTETGRRTAGSPCDPVLGTHRDGPDTLRSCPTRSGPTAMSHPDVTPQAFQDLVQEMEELIRFFGAIGAAEYDELIAQAEKDLARAKSLWEEGVVEALHRLRWVFDMLMAVKTSLTKLRPFREVAEIEGLSVGHLHNLAAKGELGLVSDDEIRRISQLDLRQRRRKAPSGSDAPPELESAAPLRSLPQAENGRPPRLNLSAVS